MGAQAFGQPFGAGGTGVIQADVGHTLGRERCRDGRAYAACARHDHPRPAQRAPLAQQPAHKTRSVKLVTQPGAIGPQQQRVAGPGNAGGGRDFIGQRQGGDLVRHGHQGALEVGHTRKRRQRASVVAGLHAHGHHHGVNPPLFKPGVVDHRRLERLRGVAQMGNQLRGARDHAVCTPRSTHASAAASATPQPHAAASPAGPCGLAGEVAGGASRCGWPGRLEVMRIRHT